MLQVRSCRPVERKHDAGLTRFGNPTVPSIDIYMSVTPPSFLAAPTTPLGVAGYTFADLHEPDRLASLYDRFCEEVRAADPALWREWDAYRAAPDAPRPPVALSNLLDRDGAARQPLRHAAVRGRAARRGDLPRATRAQDDLFRFKVDFVRRRALPLAEGRRARRRRRPKTTPTVARLIGRSHRPDDRELAVARAGCALLDARKPPAAKPAVTSADSRSAEALVRRAPARSARIATG